MKNNIFFSTSLKPDYIIGFEKNTDISPYAHVQNENLECEVEPEDINLRSFRVKDYLENQIWDEDGNLDLKVRKALMDIADDFWEFCNIRWIKPKTVFLTGSICNFNWSEFSDIDTHIVVDFKKIYDNKEFVQEYFNEKKNDWNDKHKHLKVYGYPVEMYVEDINAKTVSGGIYDLWKNKWIKEPEKGNIKPIKLNKYAIKQIASEIMTEIDDLEKEFENDNDLHKIEVINQKCEKLSKKIKLIRKTGLTKEGESSSGNIVYKVLRRCGYTDKLRELRDKIYDRLNSLNEDNAFNNNISKNF